MENINKIDLEIYIALIIILFSVVSINKEKIAYLKKFNSTKQKIFFSILGIIHGLTNLGGSLLTILSSTINKQDKYKTRYCISYGYLVMGIFQISGLYIFSNHNIERANLLYLILVFLIVLKNKPPPHASAIDFSCISSWVFPRHNNVQISGHESKHP